MKRIPRFLGCLACLAALAGCQDDQVVGPDDGNGLPGAGEPEYALVQQDVEALLAGSMAGWWRSSHKWTPNAALSSAADAISSSWKNWGMLDAGAEPRAPVNTDPTYKYNFTFEPWRELNRTLASVRDALMAIEAGVELGTGGADTHRGIAFGKFMQGMALGQLAQLFDQAYIIDEDADLATVALSPHSEVMQAALAKLDEAIGMAQAESFTIPAPWVGFQGDMSSQQLARLARSYRARLAISDARTPGDRALVNWTSVLADVRSGIQQDWTALWDGTWGEWDSNWATDFMKMWLCRPAWYRIDYRTIGPADASGAWEAWIATPPDQRLPFVIDTDDRRITSGIGTEGGTYTTYDPDIAFKSWRGTYHYSYYASTHFSDVCQMWEAGSPIISVDFPVKELRYIEAEALYRLGDLGGAMQIVNQSRANGELPPFTDPNGAAPGGERCVPQMPDGSCGDLWEALKYEKRIEVFTYGPFTEFLDDRGWGDLVDGTFLELPTPGEGYSALLEQLYQVESNTVVALANEVSASALETKRDGYRAFDQLRNTDPASPGSN